MFGNRHPLRPIDGHGQPYHGRSLGRLGRANHQTGKDAGTALPAACSSGEVFFLTGAPGGRESVSLQSRRHLDPGRRRSPVDFDYRHGARDGDSGLILAVNPPTPIHLTRVYCAVQGERQRSSESGQAREDTIGADRRSHLLGPGPGRRNERREYLHFRQRDEPMRRNVQLRHTCA